MPAMLGTNRAMQSAANAAHQLITTSPASPVHAARCDALYATALDHPRTDLDVPDVALASVGLLSLYEAIRKHHPGNLFSHADGISAV